MRRPQIRDPLKMRQKDRLNLNLFHEEKMKHATLVTALLFAMTLTACGEKAAEAPVAPVTAEVPAAPAAATTEDPAAGTPATAEAPVATEDPAAGTPAATGAPADH